jgi:uncharacterized coiled-coil protein SlyX
MNQYCVTTTILSEITDALEEHSKILVNHQKDLERLSSDVAVIRNRVKDLEAAGSLDSNDAEFLVAVSERLKAISTTLDKKI